MQFVPEAADLLAAIGKLLDEKVLDVVPPDLQHQVRGPRAHDQDRGGEGRRQQATEERRAERDAVPAGH